MGVAATDAFDARIGDDEELSRPYSASSLKPNGSNVCNCCSSPSNTVFTRENRGCLLLKFCVQHDVAVKDDTREDNDGLLGGENAKTCRSAAANNTKMPALKNNMVVANWWFFFGGDAILQTTTSRERACTSRR